MNVMPICSSLGTKTNGFPLVSTGPIFDYNQLKQRMLMPINLTFYVIDGIEMAS